MRILYIFDAVPYPPISGDRIRVYNILRRVAVENEVWLAVPLKSEEEAEGVKRMQEFCAGVITADLKRRHPLSHLPGLIRYALAGIPVEIKFHISSELIRKIQFLVTQVDFDLIHIEHSYLALYAELIKMNSSKRILSFQNITSDQYKLITKLQRNWIKKFRAYLFSVSMRNWEPKHAEGFHACIVVSEADRNRLLSFNPTLNIEVIPNGVDCHLYRPLPPNDGPPELLFIGSMDYAPCADAALFFCHKVLPIIQSKIPNIQIWIVGKDPPRELTSINIEGVHITGRVDDVIPYYQRSKVCIVPLRAGGGTRLKILEAMALGRPVVSTTIGCEGLEVIENRHLLIANSPEEFANKTLNLLTDEILYKNISIAARDLVELRYDWDVITAQLLRFYKNTCFSGHLK